LTIFEASIQHLEGKSKALLIITLPKRKTMNRLKDRVAIITGGASGIGKASVLRFMEEGAKVAIWDINEEGGKALAAQLVGQYGAGSCKFYKVNAVDLPSVETTAAAVAADFGQIDILINNAGITRDSTMKKMTAEQWQLVIDVNLTGVWNCTKAVSPYMLDRGYGRIISTSSLVGLYGNFGQANYVATKAGVIGLTKVWGREFGRKGVTANAVAPGFIATEMVTTVPEKVIQMLEERTPVGRMGKPEEIASAFVFLASDEAAFINGTTLSVDGGLVM
jgi:3-oxoacyl-[acyl-carrier protein] reductase